MKKFIFVFVAVLILAGCQSEPVKGESVTLRDGSYKKISANDLNKLLEDQDFLLINVHIPFAGGIPGTDLSIPFDQIGPNLSQLPANRNAKIVLYCRSGGMSQIAAETLVSLGYTNLWDLKGGMAEWEQAGYPIDK